MKIPLTETQIDALEAQHKLEHDGRIRDRIKADLLTKRLSGKGVIANATIFMSKLNRGYGF